MKMTSGRGTHGSVGRIVLIGGLVAGVVAAPLAAQNRSHVPDCRCVDENGKTIPDCTCFQAPSPDQLLATVMVPGSGRARLGIMVDPGQEGATDAKGVQVEQVLPGGPADAAGIQKGDIITEVDGKSLVQPLPGGREKGLDTDGSAPVRRLLSISHSLKPGQKVDVRYLRDGKSHTVTLETSEASGMVALGTTRDGALQSHMRELRERMRGLSDSLRELTDSVHFHGPRLRAFRYRFPGPIPRIGVWTDSTGRGTVLLRGWGADSTMHALRLRTERDRCPGEPDGALGFLSEDCVGGLQLVALNPGLASYFHTDEGVLVTAVSKDSGLGLQPGDVILRIGARDATSPDQVRRILRSYGPDESITFHIERKGRTANVSGRLGGS